MHILIVEDDERIVSFMQRGLEAEGYTVDTASGKAEAVAYIETLPYDLIILDIFLGLDDGLEMCRTLRGQRVRTPILIITAKGTTEIKEASTEAGADAYLPKPFAFDELISTIVRLGTASAPNEPHPNPATAEQRTFTNHEDCVYEQHRAPSNAHDRKL